MKCVRVCVRPQETLWLNHLVSEIPNPVKSSTANQHCGPNVFPTWHVFIWNILGFEKKRSVISMTLERGYRRWQSQNTSIRAESKANIENKRATSLWCLFFHPDKKRLLHDCGYSLSVSRPFSNRWKKAFTAVRKANEVNSKCSIDSSKARSLHLCWQR